LKPLVWPRSDERKKRGGVSGFCAIMRGSSKGSKGPSHGVKMRWLEREQGHGRNGHRELYVRLTYTTKLAGSRESGGEKKGVRAR